MAVLSDCPPEILAQIARLTGWSLSFRLTCKEISRCFMGPLYKYDTSVALFHHECVKYRSLPPSDHYKPAPLPPPFPITLPSDYLGEVRRGIPNYAEVRGTQIGTSYFKYVYTIYPQHREECEAIAALQLHYGRPEYFQLVDYVVLRIEGHLRIELDKHGLLKDTLPFPGEPCIPIFPTHMPLLLGYMKQCVFSVEVYARHAPLDFFIFPVDVMIFPAKLKFPWCRPVKVKYSFVHDLAYNATSHILGWAFFIPNGLANQVIYLRFSLRTSPPPPLYVEVKWIRPHHFDFPVPLDPNHFIVIPPLSPRAEIDDRYKYPVRIFFTMEEVSPPDTPSSLPEDKWISVDYHRCYSLRQKLIRFADGQRANISYEHMGVYP